MSELPAQRIKITFQNPGISPEQWFLDESYSPWTKHASKLPIIGGFLFGSVALAFLISKHLIMPNLDILDLILGMAFWPGIILFAYFEERIKNQVKSKRDDYRKEHVHLLVDTLKEQGWLVDSKTPLDSEDFPYLIHNSFRYKTYQRSIKDKRIEWIFDLSDTKGEALIKEDAKQKKIALMTEKHEKEHGVMSAEEKVIFQQALKLSL